MKYNILIVEDDIALCKGITLALKSDDYLFWSAYTIAKAKKLSSEHTFDLVILDINLPDGNGIDLLQYIKSTSHTAVVLLTANDLETDIVTGLESGADDYITKPFSLMVLRARVNAQLRKIKPNHKILIDNFYFDFETMDFRKSDRQIELSKTEQKLLRLLLDNRGNTVSRDTLLDRIWTDGVDYVDENALSVCIKRLRDKLEDNSSQPQYIKTVYGVGYSWTVK
ncbi:MAG: response regulator transcription factor [Desulfitobacteriaceae bacterium]|jgi:DNA-binding response OmpR family regulator|nr:response regulator transcription factor [Desulfitobacteriaceae bacterium]